MFEGTEGAGTLPGVLSAAATTDGDREAIVDGPLRWTFADLAAQATRFARGLVASGVAPGDRIGLWAPNSAAWAAAAFGVWATGASLVPVNTRYKGPEAAYILGTAQCRLLLAVNGFLSTDVVAALDDAGRPDCIREVVVLDGEPSRGAVSGAEFLERADGAPAGEVERRSAAIDADDIANILFTSGTTGRPKGAMLRHGATVRAYRTWADLVGLRRGDRYLVVYPFAHSAGLHSGLIACVLTGATLVPHPVFDVPSVLRRVADERITMLPGPPAVLQSLLDHPDLGAHDLSSLRLSVTGAAVVPVEMIKRMYAELPFETIVTAYGLTESTGFATSCRHDDDPETIATTCGGAIPDVEVRVVDDDGTEVAPRRAR